MIRSVLYSRRYVTLLLFALAGTGLLLPQARAQQSKQEAKPDQVKPELKIIPLRNARAVDLQNIIVSLLGVEVRARGFGSGPPSSSSPSNFRISADERTNTLVVSGTAQQIELVEKTVAALDGKLNPDREQSERQIRVFELKQPALAQSMAAALTTIVGERARFAVDPARNAIIATGDARTLLEVEAVLVRLDEPPPKPRLQTSQIRVVWLAAGPSQRVPPPPDGVPQVAPPRPPADLKPVVDELTKIGVRELQLVSQSVINVTAGQQFDALGIAVLSVAGIDMPVSLQITGVLSSEANELRMTITAVEAPPRTSALAKAPPRQLCQLQTTINAPPGHMVVLGITPTETMSSVFVVQVGSK